MSESGPTGCLRATRPAWTGEQTVHGSTRSDLRPTGPGVHTRDTRCGCGIRYGLHVICGPSPAAHAACRCGWWRTARGRRQTAELIAAHAAHREECDGRPVDQVAGVAA